MSRLSLVLLLVALAAPPAQAAPFDDLVAAAGKARAEGDLEATVKLLTQAYALKPLPALLNNLGRTYEELGRYRDAVTAYRRVADDPAADPDLRALDAARVAALQAKLGRAWVVARLDPEGLQLRVGGAPPQAAPGAEFPVPRGPQTFELIAADGASARLLRREFPVDRRTEATFALADPEPSGVIALPAGAARATALSFDRVRVTADLRTLRSVRLPVGPHLLEARLADGTTVVEDVTVADGGELALADLATPAPAPTLAPKDPGRAGPSAGAIVTLIAGAVATGVGVYLISDAGAVRDEVRQAERDARGVVVGLSLARAQQLEARGDDEATAGVIVATVGAAALVGGIVWLVLDASAPPATGAAVEVGLGPGSFGISGRF